MNTFVAFERELLGNSWKRCWGGVSVHPNNALRDIIVWKYCDPRRKYHSISHLIGCISIFKLVQYLSEEPHLLELALWIHDIESSPTSKQNERNSLATFFNHYDNYKNVSPIDNFNEIRNKLIELVMATTHQHSFEFGTQDQKLICDIDLVTLAGLDNDFEEYCQKVRQEYFIYPDEVYYLNRLSVMTYFLTRGFVYRTPYFIEHCEEAAIKNLTKEVNRIKLILEKLKIK